jgi:hypothetical protein
MGETAVSEPGIEAPASVGEDKSIILTCHWFESQKMRMIWATSIQTEKNRCTETLRQFQDRDELATPEEEKDHIVSLGWKATPPEH